MNELNRRETNRSLWRCSVEYGVANETDRRNQLRFSGLTLIWALVYVGSSWILKYELIQGPAPALWAVAILPGVLGVVLVFVYLHMLREMDEFMRRVQLDGLAVGLGPAWCLRLLTACSNRSVHPNLATDQSL